MNRPIHIRSMVLTAGIVSFLTLAACGSNSTNSNVGDTVPATTEADTVVTDAAVDTNVETTVSPSGDVAVDSTTATTAVPAGSGAGSAAIIIDPALEKALLDASTLLGSNTQDLNDASSAAANGG